MDTMVERININNFSRKLKSIQLDRSSTTENKANLFKLHFNFLCITDIIFFNDFKVCGNPVLCNSIGMIFYSIVF